MKKVTKLSKEGRFNLAGEFRFLQSEKKYNCLTYFTLFHSLQRCKTENIIVISMSPLQINKSC